MGKLTQGIRKIIRKEGYVNEIIPAVNEQRGTFVIGKTAYVVDSDDLVDLAKVINTIKKLKEKISSIKFHKLWCILMTALSLIVLPIGVWGIASTISQIVMTQEIFIEYITKTQMRTFQNIVYLLFIILGAITAFNI